MGEVGAAAEALFMRSAAGRSARSRAARGGHAAALTCPGATVRLLNFESRFQFSQAEPDSVTLAICNSQSRPT
jgi:hypothetical protein